MQLIQRKRSLQVSAALPAQHIYKVIPLWLSGNLEIFYLNISFTTSLLFTEIITIETEDYPDGVCLFNLLLHNIAFTLITNTIADVYSK